MELEAVIGLEIHIQLKTKSKMFCSCNNAGEDLAPNTTVCPVCTGQPGVLPVPNREAIEWAVKTSLALNSKINPLSKFDRKHYFYPDLPKGYQISQYDLPIAEGGWVEIDTTDENDQPITRKINLVRLHVEEDAAKMTHSMSHLELAPTYVGASEGTQDPSANNLGLRMALDSATYVDYNRGGTPLVEIVTQPDIKTPAEAKTFLQELQQIARYLDISHAEMEKGHLRCDVNISLRPKGETKFYAKTEIKNLNSFKSVERALEYEILRQTKLWEEGNPPTKLATRGWDDVTQTTLEQRVKEEAADYRYFPEPDIPPFKLETVAEKMRALVPEMPANRRRRFVDEYYLSISDAKILSADTHWANFTEKVFSECWDWLHSLPEIDTEGTEEEIMKKNGAKLGRLVGGWLTSKLMGLMAENKIDIRLLKITPENFAEFISLVFTNKINSTNAQLLLNEMIQAGEDPSQIMEEKKLGQVDDVDYLSKAIETVIRLNPDQVNQYKNGKLPVIQYMVGKVMKETEGKADPQAVKKLLEEKFK